MNRKKTIGNNQPKQMSRQYYTQKEKEKKKIVGNPLSLHCGHHSSQKKNLLRQFKPNRKIPNNDMRSCTGR
jgi:hypothetical protein